MHGFGVRYRRVTKTNERTQLNAQDTKWMTSVSVTKGTQVPANDENADILIRENTL